MRFLSLALLILGACSQTPEAANSSEAAGTASVEASGENVSPSAEPPLDGADNVAGAPGTESKPANASSEASKSETESAIPASFHGRWGFDLSECRATRGLATRAITIEPNQLTFYESRGTVKSVDIASPRSITVDADYVGEGETWSRRSSFTLLDNRKLRYRQLGDNGGTFDYIRCTD